MPHSSLSRIAGPVALAVALTAARTAVAQPSAQPSTGEASVSDTASGPRRSYQLSGFAGARSEVVRPFAVDRDGNELKTAPGLLFQARLGAMFHEGTDPGRARWSVEVEGDLRGVAAGSELDGVGLPYGQDLLVELRKAYGRYSLSPKLHVLAGAMTNHWGLGLVGNDGAHGWTPDNARFADQVSGDRVGRIAVVGGPTSALGGARVIVAGDYVLGDDVLLDDRAVQGLAAIEVGQQRRLGGGVYIARRHQWTDDDYTLDAWVLDAAFRAQLVKPTGRGLALTLEGEGVVVLGEASLAPTMDYPTQDVLQSAASLRLTAAGPTLGGVLDVVYASGDQNVYDDGQHRFVADPNFDFGLLLYRVVLAGQTGRGAGTAGDPGLVGMPAEGVDRIPTRGGVTNTIGVFPRAVYKVSGGGPVIYGGPLLAFAPVPVVDPFASRIGGGANLNALGGPAASMLGLELDVGVRHQISVGDAKLAFGLEAGALFPGDAFDDAAGRSLGTVWGGRILVKATR